MSSDLENLLIAQGNAIDQLRRSLINFKKLPKAQVTLPKTKGRLTNLEGLWEKVQALHVQLLQTATAEEKKSTHYFKDEEFLAAEDAYLDATDHLHEVIGKLSSDAPSAPYRGNESSYRDAHSGVSLHLPRISLPNFSGAFAEWENFRGIFESLVANSESLTRTQKLHYLKASLSGEAASLINNIQISDANYEAAWLLLTDEYDNRNAIIHAHIHSFADLPKMKNENVTELKKLRDSVSASLAALTNLDRPVDMWDDLLVYIISQKFSPRTRNEWNLKRGNTDAYPTYKEIHDFMTLRIRGLADYPSQSESASNSARGNRARASVNTVSPVKCVRCSGNHGLAKCNKFLSLSVEQRRLAARQHKCCFNCLRTEHFSNNCPSKGRCNQCHQAHHSLLHREGTETGTKSTLSAINSPSSAPSAVSVAAASESPAAPSAFVQNVHATRDFVKQPPHVLLATAYVSLSTIEGRTFKVRALLDQGSTYSFISESLCQTMRTRRHRAALKIHCFGEKFNGVARSQVNLTLAPYDKQGPIFPFSGYVYQRITSYTASQTKPAAMWPHLRDLHLADPDPSCNHPIHVLIGADLYESLLLDGLRQGPVGTPTGQLTIFGWILSGPVGPARPAGESASVLNCVSCEDTNSLIQSFWEDESIPSRTPLTEEDERCERHFATTHSRDSQGRYIVRLPFKNGPPRVGDTFRKASFLYSNMERRLARKPEIAAQYHDFLREYESMGHMESVRADERPPYPPIYIPHHFVLRESSTTTKLRVVFNASSESTDKTSLNDFLMAGPKLQQDIAAIILRWRLFRYVYMADIAKMFRQILVHRDDADYQRILWRPPDSLLIRLYRLLTVTYGQKPSPFLAQRSLIQLARDEGKDFPDAVNIIEESTYVDDVLFGADDLLSLLEKRKQLVGIMNRGCFPLRKWAANSAELLTDIPEDQRESSDYPINHDDTLKVLGLSWSPRDDSFRFVISPYAVTVHTKRSVLSFIAKLYDPLGWASPIVIAAKMLMQELWLRKIDWDAPIPDDLLHQWINYVSDLPNISKIRIPRWTGMRQDKIDVELHGFADASTRAYAAVVFLRIVHSPSNIQVILLAAKTKVAPLKTVSVPRLELNAVVLLIRLIEWVRNTTGLMRALLFGWTDSQIVLAWLLQHPSRWNSYVANRVSEVQTRLPTVRWQHVRSQENPADCASRGFTAADLVNHELWWSGPRWLSSTTASWPIPPTPTEKDILQTVSSEARKATVHLVDSAPEWDLPTSCSSWIRLLRITAYIRRFVRNLKNKVASSVIVKSPLTAEEIHEASVFWLRSAQATCFSDDLKALNAHAAVSRSSSLRSLHPFIGKDKLIRLGGRLENSALSYNERHPVILARHHIAELLIDQAHRRSLHGGTKLTLRCLRQNYWLISARSMIKSHIHKCVTCVRHSAKTPTQLMGDLPSPRVNPAPPFSHTGIDYAGPMNITPVVGRGQKGSKHYVAVFVCLATKAIHLESVEDYSTDGFLAAFQRFVSRRGLPSDMYSDNGTNFVGADRELQRSFRALVNNPSLKEILANDGVRWHFVPPAAPHFGGLWEAGVKSFKHHLRRVTGARTLSRSEFVTLLCKIEACLNSRPISPLSDDPSDYTALTPGHFLIGRPLTSVPEESVLEINANRLSRWQHVQLMLEQIWRSWSSDYLHSLQQRVKWTESHDNPKVDELVLLKSNLLPPSKWELARIQQVHPGLDGRVRVVTLRTANSELKRPITQICRLPASISPPGTAESR